MRKVILDSDNKVISVVQWPNNDFKDPQQYKTIVSDNAHIDDIYNEDQDQFIKPDGTIRSS